MNNAFLLASLKTDLGLSANVFNDRLTARIEQAKAEISREGISLADGSLDDQELVVMYAAWLWRSRVTGDAMPRMLRYALNNRLLSQKMSRGV